MPASDWLDDPCLRAAELGRIYYERVGSGSLKVIRTRAGGGEREAHYYNIDMKTLRDEWHSAIDQCRECQGLTPVRRRFAITAGSRRVGPIR